MELPGQYLVDMEIAKDYLHRLVSWQYSGLCLLVIAILVMHFSTIMHPGEFIFDEKFYITDARHILAGEGSARIEHPPLGTLFIAFGIFLFGDNPFGWRFFSVLLGAVCTVLFYLVCRQLNMSRESSFLATFLLSLENMSFVQAGIAMLDVYSLAFALCSFWLYLKGKYLASGVSIGLSALAKLNGALALPVIILHWLLTGRVHAKKFIASMLLAPASFLLLMPLFNFIIWHRFLNPVEQTGTMLKVTGLSTFATSSCPEMLSRPWDWILRPEILTYWIDPHYICMISPSIWVLIIPVVLYLIFRAIKGSNAAIFSLSWFIGTYLIWIPASLITGRISYVYYFYPAIGSICLGLALGLSRLSDTGSTGQTGKLRKAARLVMPCYLLLHLAAFAILVPVSYWWKVPVCIAVYVLARYVLGKGESPSYGASI